MSVSTHVTPRSLARVVPAREVAEGAGFRVRRPLPLPGLEQVDPFLLIDEMVDTVHGPGEAAGAPDHPHKGFELVTYLLAGEMEHLDSHGNHGILRAGDAQYMAAGSGLVHSEMPTADFQRSGGRRHGFQIWVNLRRADKAMAPRYRDVRADEIPVVFPEPGATARVLSGRLYGVEGPIRTVTPWTYVHASLAPGAAIAQRVPREQTATIYVFAGRGTIGPREVRAGDYAIFNADGDGIALGNTDDEPLEALLLCAEPVGEPMVRYGPFVMNEVDEIRDAFEDFRAGRFGAIKPTIAD